MIKFQDAGSFTLDKPFKIQILSAVILNIIFPVLLCEIENLFWVVDEISLPCFVM